MDRRHIKQQYQTHEDEDSGEEADDEEDQFPATIKQAKGDEWHYSVGQQEPEDEAEEMSIVVNPRKETGQEEHSSHSHKLQNGHLRVLETGPLMDHLHYAAG